ncbi:MAG: arylsulfatase [Bacteroidia bacterium]|nr:arylsulfatase [Bacteroidia bacterium]
MYIKFKTLSVGLAVASALSAQNQKNNIIYILADDLGYGDLSCYGQQKFQTPNLDRMASEGMLFTQHYAGCTVSAPSRASLMTGLHTGHTQVRGNKEVVPEGQEPMAEGTFTIGKLMQEAGYTTGIFGKWGLGYPGSVSVPGTMGFDEFYGYNCQRQAHSYYPSHLWHNNEKVLLPENDNNGRATYSQDLIHAEALQFIKNNKDKPFFAVLTYTLPHAEMNLPHDSIYQLFENSFEETPYDGKRGYTAVEKPRATFAAMVTQLDKYVGEVLDELRKQGLDKNTIVFFTSDNGPHREGGADPDFFKSYGPLRGTKRDMYEGGIRVPFIAWSPQKIAAGRKSDHASAFWDMMPTLSDLIESTLTAETDGISLLPTLFSDGKQKEHDYLYWEFHEMGGRQALRSGNWKLIRQPIVGETVLELYDLSNDLHEDNNLATQFPDKVKELETLMNNARTESVVFNFGRKKEN